MWIIKRIQKYLAEGYEVILRKDSDGAHQTSYSRVTHIEGTHLRRTMFEALSVAETYDYPVGKYTVSWIEDNDRVTFFWKGKPLDWHKVVQYESPYQRFEWNFIDEDEDDDDDRDEDELCDNISYDECCTCPTPSRNNRLKRIVL